MHEIQKQQHRPAAESDCRPRRVHQLDNTVLRQPHSDTV